MPDFEKLNQIKTLAEHLGSMPPQEGSSKRIPFGIPAKRVQWATELVNDFGWRHHPELARKEMTSDGPVVVGKATVPGMAGQRAVDKIDFDFLLDLLRTAPDVPELAALADQVQDAIGDQVKERALRDQISAKHPDLVATARQMAAQPPTEPAGDATT